MRLSISIDRRFHVLLACLLCMRCATAGELASVRSKVRQQNSAPAATDASPTADNDSKGHRNDRREHCDEFDEDDGFFESMFNEMFSNMFASAAIGVGVAATSPYWVPRKWVEDRPNAITYMRAAPYESEPYGFLLIDRIDGDLNQVYAGSSWGGQITFDYSSDFDDLQGIGGELMIDHRSRFGFETRWRTLEEDLGSSNDHLTLGAVNGTYRFAQSSTLAMRSGIGFNWLADDDGGEFGFNWVYSAEWTPTNPYVFRGVIELGTLGDAFATHGVLRAGTQYGRWQLYAGPEFFSFDGANFTLLTTGVACRF